MRSICKYIKKWAYYNGWTEDISGFLITILAGNNFSSSTDRDDLSLLATLKRILNDLQLTRQILRPVEPKKNMTVSFSDTQMDTMVDHFKNFRDNAEKAVLTASREDAQKIWRQLFGFEFPKYEGSQNLNTSNDVIIKGNKPWGN
jgi:hypothetical protein